MEKSYSAGCGYLLCTKYVSEKVYKFTFLLAHSLTPLEYTILAPVFHSTQRNRAL